MGPVLPEEKENEVDESLSKVRQLQKDIIQQLEVSFNKDGGWCALIRHFIFSHNKRC